MLSARSSLRSSSSVVTWLLSRPASVTCGGSLHQFGTSWTSQQQSARALVSLSRSRRPSPLLTPSTSVDHVPNPLVHISKRHMAKSRDKVKERKTDKPKVMLTDDEMDKIIHFDEFKEAVEAVIDDMKNNLKLNFNVQFNVRQLEILEISLEGVNVALADIVTIVRKGPDLVINLSASPAAVKPTMDAILNSELSLNPQQDGNVIYVKMPRITTQRREELIKGVRQLGLKTKDEIKGQNFQKKFQNKEMDPKKVSQDLRNDVAANLTYYIKQKNAKIDEIIIQKCDTLLNG